MNRLNVKNLGDSNKHQGIVLRGDPRNPEPEQVSIVFPGGEVTVTRTPAGDYWAHLVVFDPQDGVVISGARTPGQMVDARIDHRREHAADSNGHVLGLLESYRAAKTRERLESGISDETISAALGLADHIDALFTDPDTYHLAVRVKRRS